MTPHPATPLAVFDFDGTLIRGDSLWPFVRTYARRRGRIRPFLSLPGVLLAYALHSDADRSAKERVLRAFVGGERLTDLCAYAEWFIANRLPSRWYPPVVERLREHQRRGDRVILISASPDLYIPLVARALGIDTVACTRVGSEGEICTGRILGENCKGRAKLTALEELLAGEPIPPGSSAYGDSPADLPLLRRMEYAWLCRKGSMRRIESDSTSAAS